MEPKSPQLVAKLSEIEQRRAELQRELREIEHGLEENLEDIRDGITRKADPKHWIRKYPLPALGLAVGLGVLLGGRSGKEDSVRKGRGATLNALLSELKKVIIAKTIASIVSSAEAYVAERNGPSPSPRKRETGEK